MYEGGMITAIYGSVSVGFVNLQFQGYTFKNSVENKIQMEARFLLSRKAKKFRKRNRLRSFKNKLVPIKTA